MLTPADKMSSGTNDIIQIVITRSCDIHNCSNCTQLLPFRIDNLHMSVEVFKEAVKSLEGWPGIKAIFGGNPCLHPKFEELMEVYVELVPEMRQRGLWTNNLGKHADLVRRVFHPSGRTNLNAHGRREAFQSMQDALPGKWVWLDSSWHSPIMVDWKDLGMSEEEWATKRERCDINQKWSGGIYEREGRAAAYFCEVAGALDGIRGENHGVPAVPGWWKQPMAHFDHQVRRCCDRGCGIPLRGLGHKDKEATYDVSRSFKDFVAHGKITKYLMGDPVKEVGTAVDYQNQDGLKP